MWRLLKAEFRYNRYVLIWQYLMFLLTFFSFDYLRQYKHQVEPVIPLIIVVSMLAIFFSRHYTEARNRLYGILPLSLRSIGLARLLFQLLFWVGALGLYAGSHLIYHRSTLDEIFIFRLFFWGSLLISANAIYYVSFDLWCGFPHQTEWLKSLLIFCIWGYLILAGLCYIEDTSRPLFAMKILPGIQQWFYFSWSGVFVQYFLGIIFSWGSVSLYQHRQSYLN